MNPLDCNQIGTAHLERLILADEHTFETKGCGRWQLLAHRLHKSVGRFFSGHQTRYCPSSGTRRQDPKSHGREFQIDTSMEKRTREFELCVEKHRVMFLGRQGQILFP